MRTAFAISRQRRSESGAAALEFGLIAGTIFLPLLIGLLQYGWYFYVAQTTGGAASHIARRMAVGDCWGSGQALAKAKAEVASDPAATTLSVTPSSNSGAVIGATQLTVTVTSEGDLVGLIPMPHGGTITRTVSTMIEDTTSSGTC
jgi:Flp pilus assembly protein TadG